MIFLSEIVKSILTEGSALSFKKFYKEVQRGYEPDNATLFDCLMTLKEYYDDYIKWYRKYPSQLKTDESVYVHFLNRQREIDVALESNDVKKRIIAIDNGINQWHIDLPVVIHLSFGLHDGSDEELDRNEDEWREIAYLLKQLGKMPEKSPYKRNYKK